MKFTTKEYKNVIKVVILVLLLAEIIMSVSLAYENWKRDEALCIIGESCTAVQSSIFGEILGIKVSYMAVIAFIALLVIYFVDEKAFVLGAAVGTVTALYFIILQLFVLKEICTSCMVIDGTMLIIFGLFIFELKMKKKKIGSSEPKVEEKVD